MYAFLGLIVASLAVAAHALEPDTQIVGGYDAPFGKFPYQVSLKINNKHFCGGSIINRRTILTAAHCLVGKTSPGIARHVKVHVGSNLLNMPGAIYSVGRAVYHESFNRIRLENDIGLVTLSKKINYTRLIQPIPLATKHVAPVGSKCVLSGWGYTRLGGIVSNKLQAVQSLVFDQRKCKLEFPMVKDSHICTFTRRNQGACNGDSGSPVVANGTQIGIISFGRPCANGVPDVHTRVAYFQGWLKRNMVPDTM